MHRRRVWPPDATLAIEQLLQFLPVALDIDSFAF